MSRLANQPVIVPLDRPFATDQSRRSFSLKKSSPFAFSDPDVALPTAVHTVVIDRAISRSRRRGVLGHI
jgi:hypothetical protein